jgi:hypothetical protein
MALMLDSTACVTSGGRVDPSACSLYFNWLEKIASAALRKDYVEQFEEKGFCEEHARKANCTAHELHERNQRRHLWDQRFIICVFCLRNNHL